MASSLILPRISPKSNSLLPPPFLTSKNLAISIFLPTRTSPPASLALQRRLATFCSLSPPQDLSFGPPATREEAVSQAKLCLSSALQKPLNNAASALPSRKIKRGRQPRFRVEIPVVDDSPESLTQIALQVFGELPLGKKGSKPAILLLWSSTTLSESADRAFHSVVNSVINSHLAAVTPELLNSADMAVFFAPKASQLDEMKTLTNTLYPKPIVVFNPRWNFDEEKDFNAEKVNFLVSFDVVYSFVGLEVRGILSKRTGVVMKWAKDGIISGGEGWVVMVEEDGKKGEMKVVTRFKRRPSIAEVESVLYNLMAANSPLTKSVKFFGDLVSNVTGGKANKS